MTLPEILCRFIQEKQCDANLVGRIEARESLFRVEWSYWETKNSQNADQAESRKSFNLIVKALGLSKVKESLGWLVSRLMQSPAKQVIMELKEQNHKILAIDFDRKIKQVELPSELLDSTQAEQLVFRLIHLKLLCWRPEVLNRDRGYSSTLCILYGKTECGCV
jgi:hypothetical protein